MNKSFEKLLEDAVTNYLEDEVDNDDLVYAWNEYCDNEHYDSKLYNTPDIEEIYSFNGGVLDTIDEVKNKFDDFDPDMRYFYIDAGCSYTSTDDPDDVVCFREMAKAIIDGDLECDGLDLDEIKEEVRKECGELRPFKDKEEFEQHTGFVIGSPVTIRHKDVDTVIEGMLISITVYEGSTTLVIGKTDFTLKVLFDNWEYKKDGEWKPFGIVNETTDSANETSEE